MISSDASAWRIRSVLVTHIHADHLSRARELAKHAGARLVLPPQDRVRFAFAPIADGERIQVGHATLRALHTPGHTAESTSYVLNEGAAFTGDTLFTNGVGRPDLHADSDATRACASSLFMSLERLQQLPPEITVLPAHAGEPIAFDGQPFARGCRSRRRLSDRGRVAIATWQPLHDNPLFRELYEIAVRHLGPVVDQRHSLGEPGWEEPR